MATIEDAPIDTNYNYNDQETQELGNRSNQQGPGGADGYFPASQSSDGGREARIALRKARIEANRIARFRPSDNDDHFTRRAKKVEVESRETSKAKTQISIGMKRIDAVKDTGNETVTNIRAGVTARESIRRADESRKVQIWENKQIQEQLDTGNVQTKIDAEWSKVEKLSGPHQLNALLQTQKQKCKELLSIKTDLIDEYVTELKLKDEEYVRELKRQTEEIDKLLERMEGQFKNYKMALVEEAEQIEKSFVEERMELLTANGNETDKLFNTRKENEGKYMNERADRIEDYIKQLEQLRISDSEEYNLVKIKLETDVQVLEQQLQQMRVTYLLNQEKLEYNYQVLKKREEENGTILGAQKRKINRLADHLNLLRIKSAKQEKTFQQENTSLTDDYKHLTEQFKELQKKFRHFQLADSKRFKEIWKMNEEEAKEIMRKVLQADRIICEQQLGLKWEPPKEDLFRNVDPLSFHASHLGGSGPKNLKEAEADYEQGMNLRTTTTNGETLDAKESLIAKFQDNREHSKTMKKTLELLCNEAGFLIEDKLQKLLAPLHKDEQSLMRLDSIFKALGVESVDDVERLASFFVQKSDEDGDADHSTLAQKIHEDNAILIHPNDVVTAIRKFVEGARVTKDKSGVDATQEAMTADNVDDDISQEAATNLQKDYWNRMANVISDKSYRTWTAVYKGMEKYHTLLTQRWQTSQKITAMEQQNEELKVLLRQYMHARVNDELRVPPTQIMFAQAGMITE